MIMFAEASSQYAAPVGTAAWIAIATFLLFGVNQAFKFWTFITGKQNQQTIAPQPLAVEITKQLHEQFAGREEFEKHTQHNTQRHAQIFHELDRVERSAREQLDERFDALANERRATLEKLNDQFTFIRENIAAINRELQLKSR